MQGDYPTDSQPEAATPPALGVRDQRCAQDRQEDSQHGPDNGLDARGAVARLQRYGRNTIEQNQPSVIGEFLSHFWGPIPWMIEAALLLTAVTARWADFGIILALLLLKAGVGLAKNIRHRAPSQPLSNGWPPQPRSNATASGQLFPLTNLFPGIWCGSGGARSCPLTDAWPPVSARPTSHC